MQRLRLTLSSGERLLDRALDEGIALEHECGGKLACAACRVVILEGMHHLCAASEDELLAHSLPRARALASEGVTTLEVKSGYGLDLDSELKMLGVGLIGGAFGQGATAKIGPTK